MSTATANRAIVTPGRKTHLILDTAYPVVKETPFAFKRELTQIARDGFGPNNSENMTRLGSGAIGLTSIQETPGALERDTGNALIIPKEGFTYPSGLLIATRPMFRQQTELIGNSYTTGVSTSGNQFLVKQVTAGDTWARSHDDHIAAFGQPPDLLEPNANNPFDRTGIGTSTFEADYGFCWRFQVTGTNMGSPYALGAYYFGGPVAMDDFGTLGHYCLMVNGAGIARLFERINNTGTSADWKRRHEFRYAPADRVSGAMHEIVIKPYLHNSSLWLGYIDFVVHHTSVAAPSRGNITQKMFQEPLLTNTSTYTLWRNTNGGGPLRPNVTGAGEPFFDQPRAARHLNQFSKLGFPESGWLEDYPFIVPFIRDTINYLAVSWDGSVPSGTGLVVKLLDHFANTELTLVTSTATSRTYQLPTGVNHFRTRAEFTSDGTKSPVFTSYHINRDGTIEDLDTDEVDVAEESAAVTDVSITGQEADPSHESVSVTVEDLTDSLTVLNTRGRVAARIETEYDPADDTKRSVLWEGFLLRTPGRRHLARDKSGASGGGITRNYPAQKWRTFFGTGLGMWLRLREKISWQLFDFTQDPSTSDPKQPWKITDIVTLLLTYCGFPTDQIDVPDNSMRLFPSFGQSPQSTFIITPGQEIGSVILKLLSDYLGWFLVWDGNAGTRGMWRAKGPSTPPYANLATFRTGPTGTGKPAFHAGAYGNSAAGFYSESGAVTGFIRRNTLQTDVKPPEANAVLVLGGGNESQNGNFLFANWLVNRDGLDYFPDYTVDPQNPDFIGELVPLLYVDFALNTQTAVDYMTWRIFHTACHGIKMAKFTAPLLLITDAEDANQTQPRPLRYYDPVQIIDGGVTSQWLVRNVNPYIRKGDGRDGAQWMTIECESPRAPYA